MGRAVKTEADRADPYRVPPAWWERWIRRKGNIEPAAVWLLVGAGCLPFVLSLARMLALPGADPPALLELGHLRELGLLLNRSLTLEWVPPGDRPDILYLLLLPTGALLVAVARLTLGLQVLGLRAILLAIAFQEIGFLPSLALMAVVIGIVLAVRPSMRRIRLPLYARITVILCISAAIMIAALLIAPWLHSEAVWSVAFFPVIIMAMLAEGIAKTLAADNAVKAVWRLGWTIALALLIAVIGQITAVGTMLLQFPELILTQIVAIVFVAEFVHLRLLEGVPASLSRLLGGVEPWHRDRPRLAVVRNRRNGGVIGRMGRAPPGKYRKRSVQPAVDAMRAQGFDVRVIEGDMGLLRALKDFLPPEPRTDEPGGIVLNLATGAQGGGRFCQVPAMLEMAGVAYTGPDPVAHARLQDRYALMTLLRDGGVRVPRFALASDAQAAAVVGLPAAVSPRCEPDAARRLVDNSDTLRRATAGVIAVHGDALIEEWHQGRGFRVALIGNETIECLPLVESSPHDRRRRCPAELDETLAASIRDAACRAYRASGCRDYARIDVRVDRADEPVVVEVRWADLLARRGSFAQAAAAAGYGFPDLIRRIVDVAALRYRRGPGQAARADEPRLIGFASRGAAAK